MSEMTIEQFNNLKPGDIITLNGSVAPRFVGIKCPVTYVTGSTTGNYVCVYVEGLGNDVPLQRRFAEPYVISPDDNVDTDGSIFL